jgi:hypothetical protein
VRNEYDDLDLSATLPGRRAVAARMRSGMSGTSARRMCRSVSTTADVN